jgi:tRNA pseudouridine32 synthase/23S rRNA pseudouridine746 synthase/23S rRNA pseudouridine1911/1915/1917 synthase
MNPFSVMEILHEDEQLLVIAKPPGRLAQPDHTGDADVLTLAKRWLREQGEPDPFLGLVHRLDRPTSGVMVMARTSTAARVLSAQFRERTAEKTYLAVVEGQLRGIGAWSDYVAKPDRHPRLVAPDHPEGKYAELDWQALHRDDDRTLLRLQLHTGRPHQIRLQAAERGHPVVGDTRYGAAASLPEGAIALHHAHLRVEHPEQPRVETFVAPVPDVWSPVLSDEGRAAVERVLDRATLDER